MLWDSSEVKRWRKARRRVAEEQPLLLTGSPVCRACSKLRALSNDKRDLEVVKREYLDAMVHLNFYLEL